MKEIILADISTPILTIVLLIFIGSYGLIMSEKIHRSIVAILGASLVIFSGTLFNFYTQAEAFEAIDFNTLGLLIGMMIMVAIIKDTGIFQYAAIKSAKIVKGDPWKIMVALGIVTAVFSLILNNVTTVLLIIPITFAIAHNLKVNPIPFILVEVLMSNIGGTATLIGDPPNLLIGSAANLSFLDFVKNLGPIVLIISIAIFVFFWFWFGKKICAKPQDRAYVMKLNENESIRDSRLLKKSLFILSLTLIGFLFQGFLKLEAATIALLGAGVMLLIGKKGPAKAFQEIDWITIFFFSGLFVIIGSLEKIGLITVLAQKMLVFTQGNLRIMSALVLWSGAFFSAFVDNIPFVAAMIPLIEDMQSIAHLDNIDFIWWSLALGACLGGNGTLVGASANLVAAEMAQKAGYQITFMSFLKVGALVTLISVLLSQIYLMVRYF